MTNEPSSDEVQRWTAKRKAAVVLDLIAGKTTAAEVARSHGLTISEDRAMEERLHRPRHRVFAQPSP
jgi:transposase-like protein